MRVYIEESKEFPPFFCFRRYNYVRVSQCRLNKDGGVMTPYRNLAKFGLGGAQGTGDQMFSWIHLEDLFQIVLFLQKRADLSGVFNCTAPHPVQNQELIENTSKKNECPIWSACPQAAAGAWSCRNENRNRIDHEKPLGSSGAFGA